MSRSTHDESIFAYISFYTLMQAQSQLLKCTERPGYRKNRGRRNFRRPSEPHDYSWMQAMPRWKASIFRGTNLALEPVNISWIIFSMVSGLRILVPAT